MTIQGPHPLPGAGIDGPWGSGRLKRVMGMPTNAATYAFSTPTFQCQVVDASNPWPIHRASGTSAIQVLWTASSGNHYLLCGGEMDDPGQIASHAAHPGDTLTVPAGTPFGISDGIIGLVVSAGAILQGKLDYGGTESVSPPTHGLSHFERFNRRTICAVKPELLLERWKLTGPQRLDLGSPGGLLLTNLVSPIAIAWLEGTIPLDRMESLWLPPGLGPVTIVPGGLAYVTLAYRPDIERDVVQPLEAAGYDRATTRSVFGVPPD